MKQRGEGKDVLFHSKSIRELWDSFRQPTMYVIGVPEGSGSDSEDPGLKMFSSPFLWLLPATQIHEASVSRFLGDIGLRTQVC